MDAERSPEVNPRLTLDTAVTSCSTAVPCFVEDDDEGDEAERGVGDGVKVEVDDGVDVCPCPWTEEEVRGAHSLSEASLSASLLLSWAPKSLSLPSERLLAAAILQAETPRADSPATPSSSARSAPQPAPFSSTELEDLLLCCFWEKNTNKFSSQKCRLFS